MLMFSRLFLLAFLLFVWRPLSLYGQEMHPKLSRLTARDGLASIIVHAALQDRQGFLWFGTSGGLSKYDGYRFTNYKYDPDSPNSLRDNVIVILHEDRYGMLWAAADLGLNRYDPLADHFIRFQHDPEDERSLSHNTVRRLYEDHEGVLWIGTPAGLNRYDRDADRFTRFVHDSTDAGSLSHNLVHSIHEDREGTLWVGTERGLNRYDRQTGTFTRFYHDAAVPHSLIHDRVHWVLEDGSGLLWVGTAGGLSRCDREMRSCTTFRHDPADPTSLNHDRIQRVFEDRAGSIWVGTLQGVNRYDPQTGGFRRYLSEVGHQDRFSDNTFRSIYEDAAGTIWVGTNIGLYRYDRETDRFTRLHPEAVGPQHMSNDMVPDILEDRSGVLWIATSNGVWKLDQTVIFAAYLPTPERRMLFDQMIWKIYADPHGMIWFGTGPPFAETADGGLYSLDRTTGKVTHHVLEPAAPRGLQYTVFKIMEDRAGMMWVGTKGGLYSVDRTSGLSTRYAHDPANPASLRNDGAHHIYEDREGQLWIGTLEGPDRLDRRSGTFRHYELWPDRGRPPFYGEDRVSGFREDASGELWIATSGGGLYRYDRKADCFIRSFHTGADTRSLSDNVIRSVLEDPFEAGVLWLGTWSGGINRVDTRTGKVVYYTEQNSSLPDNSVSVKLRDSSGQLWLSTGRGLFRFNPQLGTVRDFDIGRGEAGAFFGNSGELFLVGKQGFYIFRPDQVKDNLHPPQVVLTDFKLFSQSVRPSEQGPLREPLSETEAIMLAHDENHVTFEFAALHYVNPEMNQYAYWLEGYDADWVQAGTQRTATYTNLNPGTYHFHIKAANSDNIWSSGDPIVRVTILPPWWQAWWFRLVMVGLVAGLLTGGYRVRVRHLLALERTRSRIASDLHDDIGSKMSSIAIMVEMGSRSNHLDEQERTSLAQAADSARRLVDDLRDTVWVIDAGRDNLANLIARLEQTAHQMLQGTEHGVALPEEVPDVSLEMEQRRNILMIFKEALHNALRHAGATRVEVAVMLPERTLAVSVRDDGRGFDEQAVRAGHGLRSMRERALAIGGSLSVESLPGQGTEVRLVVRTV